MPATPENPSRIVAAVVCAVAFCFVAPAQAEAPELPLRLIETAVFDPGMPGLHDVAFDLTRRRLFVAGEAGVKVYDEKRELLRAIQTSAPARCLAVDSEGSLYVGLATRIEVFDAAGKPVASWGKAGNGPGEFALITSIAVLDELLFVADAGNRRIHRFAVNGDFVDDKGGFNVPSPYFDCALQSRERLFVANPGEHRVETYDADLNILGQWGEFGLTVEDFCGCCNPSYIALFPDGRLATTEKGIPRLKVYDAERRLVAHLGKEAFPPNARGMAIAVDWQGRLALVDAAGERIRFYALEANK